MPVKKNINLLRKQIDFLDSEFIIPSLTVAKESRAHKRRNYAIYELLFSCAPSGARF